MRVHKFGDNISTDLLVPGRYFHLRSNIPELAKHTLEDVDPEFASKVKPGDALVCGKNFGLGSSREHAAAVLKELGIKYILAKSFARIFFRNAVNLGIIPVELNTDKIQAGDDIEIDIEHGIVKDVTGEKEIKFTPHSGIVKKILDEGGVVSYIKKYGKFKA